MSSVIQVFFGTIRYNAQDLGHSSQMVATPHRLLSRYFHSPGTLCRELNGARFTFSGSSSSVSGDGLKGGRHLLRFAFFLFCWHGFPILKTNAATTQNATEALSEAGRPRGTPLQGAGE